MIINSNTVFQLRMEGSEDEIFLLPALKRFGPNHTCFTRLGTYQQQVCYTDETRTNRSLSKIRQSRHIFHVVQSGWEISCLLQHILRVRKTSSVVGYWNYLFIEENFILMHNAYVIITFKIPFITQIYGARRKIWWNNNWHWQKRSKIL